MSVRESEWSFIIFFSLCILSIFPEEAELNPPFSAKKKRREFYEEKSVSLLPKEAFV